MIVRPLIVRSLAVRPITPAALLRPMGLLLAAGWLATLLATQFAGATARAQDAGEVARIEALTGSATVAREAGDVQASPGLHLLAGDSIETAAGSRVELLFADGSTLVIGPDAEIKIEDYLLAADGSRESGALTLVDGVVRAVVAPGPADSFAIQGQAAVASVRGTELLVVEENGTTSVFVVEGHVIMQGPVGIWLVKLAPGEGADARLEPGMAEGAAESLDDDTASTGATADAGRPSDSATGGGAAPDIVITAPMPAPVAVPAPATDRSPDPETDRSTPPVLLPRASTNVVSGPRPEVAAWSSERVGALMALTSLP